MKRMTQLRVAASLSLIGFLVSGCSNESAIKLRDAVVSGAATFIEQQTHELLMGVFGSETAQ